MSCCISRMSVKHKRSEKSGGYNVPVDDAMLVIITLFSVSVSFGLFDGLIKADWEHLKIWHVYFNGKLKSKQS